MEMDKSGKFSIKSVYEHLTKNENGPAYKAIWNAKVPEKVKKKSCGLLLKKQFS
jgi:hypothetical protein